jgi:hypothetical protein
METIEHSHRGHAAAGGVVAGLIGGAVLTVVMLITALAKRQDIWPVLKGASAPFLHDGATQPGFELAAVLTGLLGHLLVSAFWGALFGLLFHELGQPATVAMGAVWGVLVWIAMYKIALPLLGLGPMARSVPTSSAVAEHLMYGLGLGLGFLPFQHPRREEPPLHRAPVPR